MEEQRNRARAAQKKQVIALSEIETKEPTKFIGYDALSTEAKVLEVESQRPEFGFWYRNPQQPGQSSLGLAYLDDSQYKIVRPDFLFFATMTDGTVVADIVDPHGIHLSDALSKLKGLAAYAESHTKVYRRIEAVAKIGEKLRVLDFTRDDVRTAVLASRDARSLYSNDALAGDYR